jgi:hypothetical protein
MATRTSGLLRDRLLTGGRVRAREVCSCLTFVLSVDHADYLVDEPIEIVMSDATPNGQDQVGLEQVQESGLPSEPTRSPCPWMLRSRSAVGASVVIMPRPTRQSLLRCSSPPARGADGQKSQSS